MQKLQFCNSHSRQKILPAAPRALRPSGRAPVLFEVTDQCLAEMTLGLFAGVHRQVATEDEAAQNFFGVVLANEDVQGRIVAWAKRGGKEQPIRGMSVAIERAV